jgi:IclR family pca regulon transcriptional regulator
VQSLDRGLAVIRAFGSDSRELTLSDVARATGLNRAAARRLLHTLVELGYVRTDGRLFSLRPKILELGYSYLSSLSLPELAIPHLEHLVQRVGESSSISVLDGDEVVYVARVPTRRILSIEIAVGTRFPAYATSTGRVLLAGKSSDWLDSHFASAARMRTTANTVVDVRRLRAELNRIRRDGYAFMDGELGEGLRSLAAPIRDRGGRVVAAINVSTDTSRGGRTQLRDAVLAPLLETAAVIEHDLQTSTHRG